MDCKASAWAFFKVKLLVQGIQILQQLITRSRSMECSILRNSELEVISIGHNNNCTLTLVE